MTEDELIAEGRRLQRRTILLVPDPTGDSAAAVWYGHRNHEDPRDGYHCWLSVNAAFIPAFDYHGWVSVFTNDKSFRGGRIDFAQMPYKDDGVFLYAKEITVLPPIDAVLTCGSSEVERWLADNKWQRDWPYNSNFRDRGLIEKYQAIERQENPLFWENAYATLGGWHMGWPDDDWQELLDARLLVHTYMDSEPWVEAWRLPSGELKVIQRIT
jgi:hypothetical protein